jgi:hypothetical protein
MPEWLVASLSELWLWQEVQVKGFEVVASWWQSVQASERCAASVIGKYLRLCSSGVMSASLPVEWHVKQDDDRNMYPLMKTCRPAATSSEWSWQETQV